MSDESTRTIIVTLDRLLDHPENAHMVSKRDRRNIGNNIRRTGRYPALIVRQLTKESVYYPGKDGYYQILDGHQRRLILADLVEEGLDEFANVKCEDWSPLTDEEALIALATLNSWGGNQPRKRAELLHAISKFTDLQEAAQILPETRREIEAAKKLLKRPVLNLKRIVDQATKPDLITVAFVVGGQQKAAIARLTAAIQIFASFYGATVSNIEVKEGGEHGRVAVLTFQLENASRAIVDEAIKEAMQTLPPGSRNKRGQALVVMARDYLATHLEEETKIPLAEIAREATVDPQASAEAA